MKIVVALPIFALLIMCIFICIFNYFIILYSSLYYFLYKLLEVNFTIVSLGSRIFSETVTEFEE